MDTKTDERPLAREENVYTAFKSEDNPGPVFEPTPRGLASATASFAASMAQFAASGFKTVDKPLHELRISHCQPCDYRKAAQCSLCRCFIDQKAWLPHEDCPIGRWPT